MSIGLIIFIISVVISLISALNDKSHKKRQQNQPQTQRRKPTTERKPQKGFLGQLGDKLEEIQQEIENESQPSKQKQAPKPKRSSQPKAQPTQHRNHDPSSNTRRNQQQKERELMQTLNHDLHYELDDLRTHMDKEREKQIAILERRAQAIISDKYLSERAKKERLKQLFSNKFKHTQRQSNDDLRFNDDEVLNGMIWSEILKKPKQLQ